MFNKLFYKFIYTEENLLFFYLSNINECLIFYVNTLRKTQNKTFRHVDILYKKKMNIAYLDMYTIILDQTPSIYL